MGLRTGHTRPVGTEWRMRMRDCANPPLLGDLVFEQPWELERGFRVVGVEETRVATTFWLTLVRMGWDEFLLASEDPRVWGFVRDRRG